MTETYDVVVVGGGPAGHAAALEAASHDARVALVEAEALGGQCVHATCIPSALLSHSVGRFLAAQELEVAGVADVGDRFRLAPAGRIATARISLLARGVESSLRAASCRVVSGRGRIDGSTVVVGSERLRWRALVLATGSRWEPPTVPSIPSGRVLTPDAVHHLDQAPARVVVTAGGTARTAFGLDVAAPLAVAGSTVAVASTGPRLLPWFTATVDAIAGDAFQELGIAVHRDTSPAAVARADDAVLVVPDERAPFSAELGLDTIGLTPTPAGAVTVDDRGRTTVAGVHCAGDLTGSGFLTATAIAGGRVAGAQAAGHIGWRAPGPGQVPHVLHLPEMAWVGLGAEEAEAEGWAAHEVVIDTTASAWGVVAGERAGVLSLAVDRDLGAVLGAQAVGPGAADMVGAAAQAMQGELRIDDVAAWTPSHPGPVEVLVDAARAACRRR